MLRNPLDRIAAYPVWVQTAIFLALALAALVVFGVLALLSPFVMALAGLVLIVAILVLVVRLLRRRPLRRWGLVALTSLVLLLVFMGISNALYFSAEPERAGSPEPDQRDTNSGANPESPEQAGKQGSTERTDRERRNADEAEAKAKPGDGNAEGPQPSVTVARAVDGDTIEISPTIDGKDTVRLIGIDAPEVEKPGCGPQPLSREAAEHASFWEGQKVLLEFDRKRTDEQGRLLAYVHNPANGEMMNVDMIQSGYAQLYIVPPNTEHEDELREAQERARTASVGFGADVWSLPTAKDAQLADHGNGIGEGAGACPPEPRSAISESTSPSASPGPTQNLTVPNAPNPSVPASASPSASPSAGGSPSPASPSAGGG